MQPFPSPTWVLYRQQYINNIWDVMSFVHGNSYKTWHVQICVVSNMALLLNQLNGKGSSNRLWAPWIQSV